MIANAIFSLAHRSRVATREESIRSFKPNLLRYTKHMAEKACHVFGSTTQVGLTQVLDPMSTPREPDRFRELCEKIGLALLMGQKVQFALAHYYATYQIVKNGMSKEDARKSIETHLSKPMGNVVGSIEKDAPLEHDIFEKVKAFKCRRNWLAHDFDEEATPFLAQGERIPDYIATMEGICSEAYELMQQLDALGNSLVPPQGSN